MVAPASAPDRYHNMQEKRDYLIGTSVHDIIEIMGYPDNVRTDNGNKYLIYKAYGGGLLVGFLLWAPFAAVPAEADEGSIHCLLVKIDHDYLIRDIQLKTKGVGPTEFFAGDASLPGSCAKIIWSSDELSSSRDATEQTLTILKEQRKDLIQPDAAKDK